MGKLWARYVPNVSIFGIPLNPGPFTVKEHVIVTIMSGVGAVSAYAVSVTLATSRHAHNQSYSIQTDIIAVQKVFYNQQPPFGCQFYFVVALATSVHLSDRSLVAKNRSVAAGHVDPANWILDRWHLQTHPRVPTFHDLAREPRDGCTLQHVAFPGDFGHPFFRWYCPRSLLHLCFCRLPLIQSELLSLKVLYFNADCWLS